MFVLMLYTVKWNRKKNLSWKNIPTKITETKQNDENEIERVRMLVTVVDPFFITKLFSEKEKSLVYAIISTNSYYLFVNNIGVCDET